MAKVPSQSEKSSELDGCFEELMTSASDDDAAAASIFEFRGDQKHDEPNPTRYTARGN